MDLKRLREANIARQRAWPGSQNGDLAFSGLELGGEVGELLNLLKKMVRIERGIKGQSGEENIDQKKVLLEAIKEELADVVICADLIALKLDIDLAEAVPDKFDKTSKKNDIPVYFSSFRNNG